jgi:hypothetical protein
VRVLSNSLTVATGGALHFEDDKGRRLYIQTNQPYVFRTEEQIEPDATTTGVLHGAQSYDPEGDDPDEDPGPLQHFYQP